jgi:hypothetical protein
MNYPYSNYFWDIHLARKRLARALTGPGSECHSTEDRSADAGFIAIALSRLGFGRDDPGCASTATEGGRNNRKICQRILLIESCRMMQKSG